MAKRVFNLKDVPDDEAHAVREVLHNNAIQCYETKEGMWGFSLPAIWINDDAQFNQARALIDEVQRARGERIRSEHARNKAEGSTETFYSLFRRQPLKVIFYIAAALVVLYFSIVPFVRFMKGIAP